MATASDPGPRPNPGPHHDPVDPRNPTPMPGTSPAPVREPEPNRLPDENPLPNPDENDGHPQHVRTVSARPQELRDPIAPVSSAGSDRPEVVTPREARQGRKGYPVLWVLIGGLALAMIAWGLAEFYGVFVAEQPETLGGLSMLIGISRSFR